MNDLRLVSKESLIKSLDIAIDSERMATADIVAHVGEVYRRKLHLELGYSSLYTFISQKYRLSEGSTYRRVSAAKLSLKHPDVVEKLRAGALTLCSATEAWKAFEISRTHAGKAELFTEHKPLTKKEEAAILTELTHKTKAETKNILLPQLSMAPRPAMREQVIRMDQSTYKELRLPITPEQELKYERLKNLLSHKVPTGDSVKIFDILIETALNKFDPTRVQKRVEQRRHNAELRHRNTKPSTSKAEEKRKTWSTFDKGCAYQDPKTGQKCSSQRFLDVDHVIPKLIGGKDAHENYQLLCAAHNRAYKQGRLL